MSIGLIVSSHRNDRLRFGSIGALIIKNVNGSVSNVRRGKTEFWPIHYMNLFWILHKYSSLDHPQKGNKSPTKSPTMDSDASICGCQQPAGTNWGFHDVEVWLWLCLCTCTPRYCRRPTLWRTNTNRIYICINSQGIILDLLSLASV